MNPRDPKNFVFFAAMMDAMDEHDVPDSGAACGCLASAIAIAFLAFLAIIVAAVIH